MYKRQIKPSGDLRVCLDPSDLNNEIQREHYKTLTTEEITHEFAHSKFFSRFDVADAYWSIKLDYDSSLLTTFNSPFGRYRFKRLPFGLVCSQDIFQKRMDQILEKCEGCINIADDINIHGCTEEEHDRRLRHLMHVARQHGLIFSRKKTSIKEPFIKFFGCIYDANGVHPDPEKVAAVHSLPAPTDVTKLQEFLGLVTYLHEFIPGLSTLTAPLRELLKKDADFIWNSSYDAAFNRIKQAVVYDCTLRYYDVHRPVTIQVDASKHGLGAALLQDGKPVAFARLACESNWFPILK